MGDSKDPEEENEARQFKIVDRRQFTSEGKIRQESETEPEPDEAPPPQAEDPPPQVQEEKPPETAEQDTQEGMNFSSFLLSLATTGRVHLGEIPEPTTGQKLENCEMPTQIKAIHRYPNETPAGTL